MKKCRVLFSFDDARADTYNAVLLAEQYGIKSTINVTTEYVNGTISDLDRPSVLPSMSKQQVLSLKNDKFVELACHSANHKNTFDDIMLGKKQLIELLEFESEMLGFASPNSKVDLKGNALDRFRECNFSYVRIGHLKSKFEKINRVFRKISRIFGLKQLLYTTYKNTLKHTVEDNYLIHGIPVLNDNTVEQFKCIVNHSIKNGFDCIFIFHSVLDDNDPMANDTWTWNLNKYISFCEFLRDANQKGLLQFSLTKDLIISK